MTGPRVEQPLEQDPVRMDRVRDLKTAIECAAVGHAASLYHAKAKRILEVATPPQGHGLRVLRKVMPRCPDCGGLGIRYTEEERPADGPMASVTFHFSGMGNFHVEPPRGEPVVVIRECACVSYEVHLVKVQEPEQAQLAEPSALADATGAVET